MNLLDYKLQSNDNQIYLNIIILLCLGMKRLFFCIFTAAVLAGLTHFIKSNEEMKGPPLVTVHPEGVCQEEVCQEEGVCPVEEVSWVASRPDDWIEPYCVIESIKPTEMIDYYGPEIEVEFVCTDNEKSWTTTRLV